MAYSPYKFTEWHFNALLAPFFTLRSEKLSNERQYRGWQDYMLISLDWDLYKYFDLKYKPTARDMRVRKEMIEKFDLQAVNIKEFGSSFLPDAVLLDQSGKPFIFEVKKELSGEKACNDIVLQTMIYANIIIEPSFHGRRLFNTYEFLDLLYRAHWFRQEYDGGYTDLKKKHAEYFGYTTVKRISEKKPGIIFALVNPRKHILLRLEKACKMVRELKYNEYKVMSGKIHSANCQFRKRIDEIKKNWNNLKKIEFSIFPINLSVLESTIEERYLLLEEED